MKKISRKIIAYSLSLALIASMFVGANINSVNAEDNLLTGEWTHIHDSYEANDALIAGTKVNTNGNAGFTADITITGWQRNWYGVDEMPDDAWPYADGWADNPYQLRSYTTMNVTPKSTYQLTFEIENHMTSEVGNPTEKNVTITVDSGIEGDTDNTFLFTTVRVSADGTLKFDRKFTVPENYTGETVMIEIAYGSYAYSYGVSSSSMVKLMPADVIAKYCFAPGTSENVNAGGELSFNNISAVQVAYEEPTTKAPTVEEPTTSPTTDGNKTITIIEECKCPYCIGAANGTKVEKPSRASVKSTKNIKGKKVKVVWKKVKNATKYQVRAVLGKKIVKKTTKKLNYTFKKLKKNKTYKISVRAYNSEGYGKWSKVIKVKITK